MVAEQLFALYQKSVSWKKVWFVGKKLKSSTLSFTDRIASIGISRRMDYLEKRKLKIFNLLLFFQLITILILPVEAVFYESLRTVLSIEMWLPALVNCLVLWLHFYKRYNTARRVYFIGSPVITALIYVSGINLGVELNFILYGVLAVFLISGIGEMVFSIAISMVSYYMLSFLLSNYQFELSASSFVLYLLNQALILVFIFYGLYLVKKDNAIYQRGLVFKTRMLHQKNQEIRKHRAEISQKAQLLETQTHQLIELNGVKDKLFSVIAHDMKTPLYALKNLFLQVQQNERNMNDLKGLVPDIVNDLNFTTELMENLLHWSKSQMQQAKLKPRLLEISALTESVMQLLRLPAKNKQICLENTLNQEIYALGDRDMIHLVLRNLVSNAIKFTPMDGRVRVGASDQRSAIEIFVEDTGLGISREAQLRILNNEFYSTKGTSNESGTGLGLMLCKDFISRHGGEMYIDSNPGKGSIFRFTIPKAI